MGAAGTGLGSAQRRKEISKNFETQGWNDQSQAKKLRGWVCPGRLAGETVVVVGPALRINSLAVRARVFGCCCGRFGWVGLDF